MICLLIDDDLDDQEVFRLCLGEALPDVRLTVAQNGPEALKMIQQEPGSAPDVIFLDLNMPKMDGLECLKTLRQIGRLQKTAIFLYSTTSSDTVLKEARALGADDYVIKPGSAGHLKEILENIFAKCRQRTR